MIYARGTNVTYTHTDRGNFTMRRYPNDVWVLQDNSDASTWASNNNLTVITKAEAQSFVDSIIATSQADYDDYAMTITEEKTITQAGRWLGGRPTDIVLP